MTALLTPDLRRRRLERGLVWLEVLLAVGAYGGALGLVTGGIDLGDEAGDLPFESPVFGGVALAVINGLLPTAVAVGALLAKPWAGRGHVAVGVALVSWIVIQVAFLGVVVWLHIVYFLYGLAITGLAVWHQRCSQPV